MLRVNAVCRTVWVKELVTVKRQGNNGEYDSKSILFRVATPRNYTRTVMKDGQQVEERPTDYILCRANGATAQVIADYCSAVDAEGKHISRHLNLVGHIETYQTERNVKIENLPVGLNGQTYNLTFETPVKQDSHIFIVDELEFLDPKKETPVQSANGVAVSNVSITPVVAQPQTQAVQSAPVAPAPVVQQTPVQVEAPQVAPVIMNPPTVPEGYTGEDCPY